MLSWIHSLFINRTTQTGSRLLLLLLPAAVMVIVWKRDEGAIKREQRLKIDVAFIIHGSKNITSPERKETYKEALNWAKKIIKAFGEIGINKTRAGMIVYAEKPKLLFNFTDKLTKGEVLGAIDEAESPPDIGNKTFTGKALQLAMDVLVNGTREEASKKFFVFSDRPPDDNPMPPVKAMSKKEVDIYGLGQSTAPYNDWYIPDYGLDSMYAMMAAGPFKVTTTTDDFRKTENTIKTHSPESSKYSQKTDAEFHKELAKITYSINHVPEPSQKKINQIVTVTSPNRNRDTEDAQSSNLPQNSAAKPFSDKQQYLDAPTNPSSNSRNALASVISQKVEPINTFKIDKNNYGNDASVIITANSMKSGNSVGRYSTGSSTESFKPTDFGTVIGGTHLKSQSQLSVIKPASQNSTLRSKLHQNHKHNFLKKKHIKNTL